MSELTNKINDKFQTLTYFGINNKLLRDFVLKNRLTGIDRIVPMGKALDMGHIWDGNNLIKALSRIVEIN